MQNRKLHKNRVSAITCKTEAEARQLIKYVGRKEPSYSYTLSRRVNTENNAVDYEIDFYPLRPIENGDIEYPTVEDFTDIEVGYNVLWRHSMLAADRKYRVHNAIFNHKVFESEGHDFSEIGEEPSYTASINYRALLQYSKRNKQENTDAQIEFYKGLNAEKRAVLRVYFAITQSDWEDGRKFLENGEYVVYNVGYDVYPGPDYRRELGQALARERGLSTVDLNGDIVDVSRYFDYEKYGKDALESNRFYKLAYWTTDDQGRPELANKTIEFFPDMK